MPSICKYIQNLINQSPCNRVIAIDDLERIPSNIRINIRYLKTRAVPPRSFRALRGLCLFDIGICRQLPYLPPELSGIVLDGVFFYGSRPYPLFSKIPYNLISLKIERSTGPVCPILDLRGLAKLRRIECCRCIIKLEALPDAVSVICCTVHPDTKFNRVYTNTKVLVLVGVDQRQAEQLPKMFPNLNHLELNQSTIRDLSFFEHWHHLRNALVTSTHNLNYQHEGHYKFKTLIDSSGVYVFDA